MRATNLIRKMICGMQNLTVANNRQRVKRNDGMNVATVGGSEGPKITFSATQASFLPKKEFFQIKQKKYN